LVGAALGVPFLVIVVTFIGTLWVAAALAFLYGLIVVIPGALSIKFWRSIRDLVGG
jgi:hypothetical protein